VLVATTCVMVFLLSACIRLTSRDRPLEQNDIHRLRRFSEKLQKEDSLPFE
jgi:hypothetical protein